MVHMGALQVQHSVKMSPKQNNWPERLYSLTSPLVNFLETHWLPFQISMVLILRSKPKVSHMLDKHSAAASSPSPQLWSSLL